MCNIGSAYSDFFQIVTPDGLQQQFSEGIYASIANFGKVSYQSTFQGTLIFFPNSFKGCADYTDLQLTAENPILVVDRGQCEPVEKLEKAVASGAIALIIINFFEFETENLIMQPPEDYNDQFQTFAAFIDWYTAQDLRKYQTDCLKSQPASQCDITISWDLFIPVIASPQFEVYYSNNDIDNQQQLEMDLKLVRYARKDELDLIEYPKVINTDQCIEDSNCNLDTDCMVVGEDPFCTYRNVKATGKDMILFFLYSNCALQYSKDYYEAYIEFRLYVHNRCNASNYYNCYILGLGTAGFNINQIIECVGENKKSDQWAKSNQFLQQKQTETLSYSTLAYGVKYNGVMIKGKNRMDVIKSTFCTQFDAESNICTNVDPTPNNQDPQNPTNCATYCTEAMLQNSVCDLACNNYACNYDHGNCKTCAPDCYLYLIGDGKCDPDCLTSECSFDSLDCCTCSTLEDSHCDEECNIQECQFDKGDCKQCAPGCYNYMINDETCHKQCFKASCEFDGDDCNCNCNKKLLGNGKCEEECNTTTCDYDLKDCLTKTTFEEDNDQSSDNLEADDNNETTDADII